MLEITGAVARPLVLSLDDVRHLFTPHQTSISFLDSQRTVNATFTGARLWDMLAMAQVEPRDTSRLRVEGRARDDFRCLLRWHEVDPAQSDRLILIAYQQDGQPLAHGGPLRLVVPGDERGVRSLRDVIRLTVIEKAPRET